MIDDGKVIVELSSVVEKFNEDFKQWMERTGCVASFQWNYLDGKEIQIKAVEDLSLTQIDKIIYRKEPPSDADMEKALGEERKIK